MEHRLLGRTGVSVSKLCLGAMMFGHWGNKDHDESIRIIHRALDAGINFIDTADIYSQGESEVIVGKALAGGRRDDVVLATKVWGAMGDDPNRRGTSRRWIIREVEDSLRRPGTDWIDLYQIHRFEPDTDMEETLGALTDLVHQGKVRYIGSSTFPASAIVEGQWAARDQRLQRFVCEQPPYSMLTRGIEADVLPTCARYGMGVIPPAVRRLAVRPLAQGRRQPNTDLLRPPAVAERYDLSLPANQRKLEAAEALAQLAEEAGMSLIEMAIAFVINHPAVTAAIIGPRTMEQLESQLPAADIELSADVLDRIDKIVTPGTNLNPADGGWSTRPCSRQRDAGRSPAPRGGRPMTPGREHSALPAADPGLAVFVGQACERGRRIPRSARSTGRRAISSSGPPMREFRALAKRECCAWCPSCERDGDELQASAATAISPGTRPCARREALRTQPSASARAGTSCTARRTDRAPSPCTCGTRFRSRAQRR
jgi:aryl-alcohol dehydrogenase-like predicted oxidoreductase